MGNHMTTRNTLSSGSKRDVIHLSVYTVMNYVKCEYNKLQKTDPRALLHVRTL